MHTQNALFKKKKINKNKNASTLFKFELNIISSIHPEFEATGLILPYSRF